MGQKVHPYGFRLGYNKNWQSRWYSAREYADFVLEDNKIRKFIKKLLFSAGLSKLEIERAGGKVRLILHTARPGIVIGRKGVEIENLRKELKQKFGREFSIEVNEIRRPEIEAQLVAENIAQQLERRVAFRRAMKRTVTISRKFGAEGIKVNCAGRLAGAEIARTEWYRDGRVPLQTLRADIDFGFAEAATTYGIIGVKVWVFKGELLDNEVNIHAQP
jgi:small subunit ribosomal protein S3